jgi:hypothetical protein
MEARKRLAYMDMPPGAGKRIRPARLNDPRTLNVHHFTGSENRVLSVRPRLGQQSRAAGTRIVLDRE